MGCDACDGSINHVGHGSQQFLYKGHNQSYIRANNISIDPFTPAPGDMMLDPASLPKLQIKPGCAKPNGNKATLCKSSLRTVNTQAKCGSPEDYYFYSPWRAPGSAPVIDSCGSAGGRFPGMPTGSAGAQYQNTSLAKEGDAGSSLPPMPSQASWKAGVAYEVGWTVAANHGGGYAYRMAPADGPLTEAQFRKTPLDFVGNSTFRWGGDKATELSFDALAKGWQTNEGTTPAGSQWRKNPIPSGLWQREGPAFAPACQESKECIDGFGHFSGYSPGGTSPMGTCKVSRCCLLCACCVASATLLTSDAPSKVLRLLLRRRRPAAAEPRSGGQDYDPQGREARQVGAAVALGLRGERPDLGELRGYHHHGVDRTNIHLSQAVDLTTKIYRCAGEERCTSVLRPDMTQG